MTGQEPSGAVRVRPARAEDAAAVVSVIHAGFGAREVLDPPSTATDETVDSVRDALARHGGLLAVIGSMPVGALLLDRGDDLLGMRRVAVDPSAQGMGVAGALVATAERVSVEDGYDGLRLAARAELPGTVSFWEHLGYAEVARAGTAVTMAKLHPVDLVVDSAERARQAGRRLAGLLRAGDLVILTGGLGAGKTTFTQGIGAGLGVRGDITSPTFVIARVHPSLVDGPPLVHVDAYRIGGVDELDDLDLDTAIEEAVTVVEWGEGLAEPLAETRLEVTISRAAPGAAAPGPDASHEDAEPRHLRFTPVGGRWIGSGLRAGLA